MNKIILTAFALVFIFSLEGVSSMRMPNPLQENPAVTNLRNYLRIKTAHPEPEPGYDQAILWLQHQAKEIGLDFHYVEFERPALFALWMTWNGTDPNLKSVLLNSHMDVVNADPSKWKYPPYEAYKDDKGNIYARGASDMKSATIAELEALRRLKESGFQPLRTIHMSVLPDEELSGKKGIVPFTKTDHFNNLNVGIDIDEGLPSNSLNHLAIINAEKNIWQFNISVRGVAGHASNLPEFTAGQRIQVVIDKLMAFRQSELDKLKKPNVTFDQITSLNLVRMGGGIGDNVIPNELWASFDMRIWLRPDWNFTDAEQMILDAAEAAKLGSEPNDVSVNFIVKSMEKGRTPADESNIWWTEAQKTCRELGITCTASVIQAATDGRYVRDLGIPVFGISPFTNTPMTAHQDDEFVNENEFLRGIDRYVSFIRNFASVPGNVFP